MLSVFNRPLRFFVEVLCLYRLAVYPQLQDFDLFFTVENLVGKENSQDNSKSSKPKSHGEREEHDYARPEKRPNNDTADGRIGQRMLRLIPCDLAFISHLIEQLVGGLSRGCSDHDSNQRARALPE